MSTPNRFAYLQTFAKRGGASILNLTYAGYPRAMRCDASKSSIAEAHVTLMASRTARIVVRDREKEREKREGDLIESSSVRFMLINDQTNN